MPQPPLRGLNESQTNRTNLGFPYKLHEKQSMSLFFWADPKSIVCGIRCLCYDLRRVLDSVNLKPAYLN